MMSSANRSVPRHPKVAFLSSTPGGTSPQPKAAGPAGRSGTHDFPSQESPQRLHRIATVRKQQGVSLRAAARQLGGDMSEVRSQEDETHDMRLSELLAWQKLLDVPLAELLVEPGTALSRPVLQRAQLLRVMKTVATIRERATTPGLQRLAEMLYEQMLEIIPDMRDVSPWHSVGQRRSLDEYGRVVDRMLHEDALYPRSPRD